MPGKYYMLVNPYIEGKTHKIFKASNSLKAAKQAYGAISKYFNNKVENFRFSMLKLKSDSIKSKKSEFSDLDLAKYAEGPDDALFSASNFSHFVVDEHVEKDGTVDYVINKFDGQTDNTKQLVENILQIQKKYKKLKKSKKSDSDSSSKSSESESESSSSESEQEGGKKHSDEDDDEDEDDDSPDYYYARSHLYDPISYWYYYPPLYPLDTYYIPSFVSPFSFYYAIGGFNAGTNVIFGSKTNPTVSMSF